MRVFDESGNLEQDAKDVLYEIGNMGVGKATISLGRIRQMEIYLETPKVFAMDQEIFSSLQMEPDQIMLGIVTKMNGEYEGNILFCLSVEFIKNTILSMTGTSYREDELLENEECYSALKEIVNIMTSSYGKVMGSFLDAPVYLSPVMLGVEEVQKMVLFTLENGKAGSNKIASVQTGFVIKDENGNKTKENGNIIICPNEKSIQKFMEIMC